jgi:uncharacterized protein (DUF486 family)
VAAERHAPGNALTSDASAAVFAGFCWTYMKQPLELDFLWAGLCLVAAVYFVFR